ncbi:MAG TPA: serine/threonine-protein kinase [Kofleriaceae bacterium]
MVYLITYVSRRRAEHGWLAAQSLLAAAYPLWRLDLVTSDGAVAVAITLACAASVVFTRAHFGLPAPSWTWLALAALGVAAGALLHVGAVTVLVVAAAVAHQIEELWRLSRVRRLNARILLVAWASLGVGVAFECVLGYPTAIVGLTSLAFLYTVALARQHGHSLEQLENRLATIETKSREIETLNEELRRQIGLRSRQLAKALASAGAAASTFGTGEIIAGRYRVAGHLGTGGMGIVYEVARITDGRAFALKLLHGNARGEVLARFAREAEILAQLHHPNLVSIVDVDVCDGQLFIVMELVEGMSLAACDRRAPAWSLQVLTDIAAGLVAIHGAGIVHRDLKPANVLVSAGGPAKIADFGVSTFDPFGAIESPTIDPLTATGAILGTPGYMAPELMLGMRAAGPAVDVFAFGVLAYQLFGGKLPSGLPRTLADIAPALPADLVELVDACLATEPSARPISSDVLARLRALPALSYVAPAVRPRPPTTPTLARGSTELPTMRRSTPGPLLASAADHASADIVAHDDFVSPVHDRSR